MPLHVSRIMCSSSGGQNCISIFISVINQLGAQNFCFTISLFHASTCFDHHVLIIRRSKLYYTSSGIITPVHGMATYSCDDTRGCVIQFWPLDDEHMCSKHVEAWNKLIVKQKFCAWMVNYSNKYTEMHGQQNVNILCVFTNFPPWKLYIC